MTEQPFSMAVGKGHRGISKLPDIQRIGGTRGALAATGLQPGTVAYQLGRCLILVSPPYSEQGWHMSISHPDRYPTWDEVAKAWYELVPDADAREAAMILPRKADYINIHDHCFQIHELPHDVAYDVAYEAGYVAALAGAEIRAE